MPVNITYDGGLLDEVAARFDLRDPNKRALEAVVKAIEDAGGAFREMVADLATGVGKTFLMSSLIDYLAQQGVRHILVVTPGGVIQGKTLANFDAASAKYVAGAEHEPVIITPDNFAISSAATALANPHELKVFVFNVQQLIKPTVKASRKVRKHNEEFGDDLYTYLQNADDLFVISDEHHVYNENAAAFSSAIRDLQPNALIGLTATPDKADYDKIVFQYSLGEAIADEHVKVPVIVYRKDGTKDERTQLADACQLLRIKEASYRQYEQVPPGAPRVNPVLFVVASTIEHATEVGQILASPGFIGDPKAVLEITAQSSDEALATLASVESPDSPIRAVVSVNKLREGWDVKNIAVIVALRKLASQTLTEQILGRGLRLPYGKRTQSPPTTVDQVDLVAHDSYQQLLAQKDVLRQRIHNPAPIKVDQQGAATDAGDLPVPDPDVPTGERPNAPLPKQETNAGQLHVPEPDAPTEERLDLPTQADTEGTDRDTVETSSTTFTWGDEDGGGALFGVETEERTKQSAPEVKGRINGAPQIKFPRRSAQLTYGPFSLSDIADGDAETAGTRFIQEVPTFLVRDALEAKRTGDDVSIRVTPQKHAEAQQMLTGIDTIRMELGQAVLNHPGVQKTQTEKNAARRIVKAFFKGAGVTNTTETAEWGQIRRQQATHGIEDLIRQAYARRRREMQYSLVPVTLPIEPVLVAPDALDAYNDPFAKHMQFTGWQRNIMPSAAFDAKTTEWSLAHLLDREPAIAWWLRVHAKGPAYIPTKDGNYFPDFIALDTEGGYWLIEGKSNKNANDADVLVKREAAEHWARSVRDDGSYGTWRYVFATESDIMQAGSSWAALLVATNPE
ncbi:DEAD/DEAH box helicase family protein [Streptomyces sp. NPDC053728]|uniref:DEAD/DEAH box helicase n=1 Tax=Streptomyces sp. NPDC053728 TaxID=3155534 RepID=UPI003446EFFC